MKFHRSITAFVLVLLFVSTGFGQWRMLKDFGAQIYSIHFLDREGYTQIGFVGLTTGEVWRTSDGGVTWLKTTTPPTLIGAIRYFTFKDSLTGWLAASQAQVYSGCYMTTDAGMSWTALSPTGQRMAIFYNPKTQALILNGWSGSNSIVSTDLGTAWNPTGNNSNTCGIAFTDSLHGLMTIFPANVGGNYSSTTDGGLTWKDLTQSIEAWQPLAIKGTHTYLVCAEGARQIQRSDDDGKTWTLVHQFPATLDLSGDIHGDLSALYIQGKTGTFYSVDQGVTWTDYCGPKNDFDTRMYSIGDSLYAGTLDGQLWINPFGVKRNRFLLKFPNSPFDLVSSGCQNADSLFRFTNLSNCLAVKLLSLAIVPGPGAKTFSFKKPIFPVTLDSTGDSVKITYTPDNNTTDSAQFEIKYSVGGEIFTAFVWLRGFVRSGYNVTLSKDLNLLLSSDCSQLDTFVTIKSGLCTADTLLAVKLSDPTAFTVTPPVLPAAVAPGVTLQIPISVKSLPAGSYSAILTLTIRSGGVTKDTTINLSDLILSASDPRTNLTPGFAKFDTVSICALAEDTIILKNTICKDLIIKGIAIQPAAAATQYSIIRPSPFPYTVTAHSSDTMIVQYKPTTGGPIAGTVVLTLGFDLVNTRDTSIPISGIGRALAGSALGSDLLAFSTTVPCTVQELSTQLYNNSCGFDTVVTIIPATDNSFTVLSPVTPATIASGDSTLIRIQEDPLSPGAKFDSVRVVIHSSTGAIDTVNLKVSGIVNRPVHTMSLLSLLKLDSLAPCTPMDTTLEIKNLGTCDTLIVDSLTLTGPGWFVLDNTTLPARILPGGSFFYTLHFAPGAKANGSGSIHIEGYGIDTTMNITANSRTGGAPVTLTLDSIFASTFCKPATHTFTLQNTSCDTIIFDDISLRNSLGTQFTSTPSITLPLVIPPGQKQDITVSFDPSAPGDSIATFSYRSIGTGVSRTVTLTGKLTTVKQTAHLELIVDPNLKLETIQAGSSVTVHVLLQDAVDAALGLREVKTTLMYYDDVLSVLSETPGPGWQWATPPSLGKGLLTLDLSRTDNASLPAGSEVATVKYESFVADSGSTPIDLENSEFNGGDPIFSSCVLAAQSLQPVTITVAECGSTVLRGFINHDNTVFSNITIRPNPASSGAGINVGLQLNQQSDLSITVHDELGKVIAHISKPSLPIGLKNIVLDLPKVGSGLYILSIQAGGMRESHKILIED
ncbi:MAG: choice-of-anchor D domain-containing protein [Bacteroidota bacterium]|nr:choice-of-anchor D domain-containing protein [Bacteroidota bacterium]